MKQASFLPKTCNFHGGKTRAGKRKISRPFSPKNPMHIVFKSSFARGDRSMLTSLNRRQIEQLLHRCGFLYQIKIFRFANVGNHLHLIIQTQNRVRHLARRDLAAFLRHFAGTAAMIITGACKGTKLKFWDQPVYSRILAWGRDFKSTMLYLVKNLFQAAGVWSTDSFIPNFGSVATNACATTAGASA